MQMTATHIGHRDSTEEDKQFPHLTTAAMWAVGAHHMDRGDFAFISNGEEEYYIVRTR